MTLKPQVVDFTVVWTGLLDTVKAVISCCPIAKQIWNDRFSDVYALCVARPEPLMERLYQETKVFIENHVQALYEEVTREGETNILARYHKHWTVYSQGAAFLNQLYGFLNSQFIKKQKLSEADIMYGIFLGAEAERLMEVGELALDVWKNVMIERLHTTLVSLILSAVQTERQGGTVNQVVIYGVISSFVEVEQYKTTHSLKLYENTLETHYREQMSDYYRQEAARLKEECTFSDYMEKVIQRLRSENQRSRRFLHSSSFDKMTRECEARMVVDHLDFLNGECQELVENERRKDLTNMYELLKPIHGALNSLIHFTETYIRRIALDVIQSLKGDNVSTQFVESLLHVHQRFTELVHSVYQSDRVFVGALDRACAEAINWKPNAKSICRSPELVARYCDNLLKKNTKGLTEAEQEDKLTRSIVIFKYLDDKDVFQRVYSKMLAKRLIYGQSISMDSEEAMINRLKQACGYEFTSKLHRMFTDMSISADLQTKFMSSLTSGADLDFNFSILVLQAGAWPLTQTTSSVLALPQELEKSVQSFERFYNRSFSGRKLTWMYHHSSADLKLNYLSRSYFVTVSMYHMAILLLFNKCDVLSVVDLCHGTQLADRELLRQLQTLVDARILTVQGVLSGSSLIQVNANYVNKRTKFKIISTIQKDSTQDSEATQTAVNDDRKMYLQAAIVRVMKARKVLKHTLLINEVISLLKNKFSPPVHLIKKSIEILIDKQYLQRTLNSTDEYSYIA